MPKDFHWVDGATHVDLHDKFVPQVAERVAEFFAPSLQASASTTNA
ncbi:hypothetical protein SK803_08085 [Lentzea sp. BCCO 10_0856]|uniref:Uncharacterized protein n=1 Tax=Lentzea miocenica TaxID=3095431 RepID=A0ABU4SW91_9PSEU|nr:hypothetical protein [Lentzea sp. BCCO 10_0856]MDX8030166.1 hypothetical protein [Lentzea sp. BCCO 10_0856]